MFFQPDEFAGACTPCVSAATSQVETPILGLPQIFSEQVGTEPIAVWVAVSCPSEVCW